MHSAKDFHMYLILLIPRPPCRAVVEGACLISQLGNVIVIVINWITSQAVTVIKSVCVLYMGNQTNNL